MKNISAIEKIIAELAKKYYLSANPRRSLRYNLTHRDS